MRIETLIDGAVFVWTAKGRFAWGHGPALCRFEQDPLLPGLGSDGYRIVDLPPGCAEQIAERAAALLGFTRRDLLPRYHRDVHDMQHLEVIKRTRDLRLRDLAIPPGSLSGVFGRILGVRLAETVAALDRDHVQLRINRPNSTDYNPPHRDGSLPIWTHALNVWIPVAGVDELTSLPIVPGSHRVAEEACWQTEAGGVAIRGRQYRVPAIARLRRGPLDMIRTTVAFGQALLFTPFLIHGLAVNQSNRTRMALELRLDVLSH